MPFFWVLAYSLISDSPEPWVSGLCAGKSPGEGNGNPPSSLAWEIPWTEETGRLQSMGSQKSQNWAHVHVHKQKKSKGHRRGWEVGWNCCHLGGRTPVSVLKENFLNEGPYPNLNLYSFIHSLNIVAGILFWRRRIWEEVILNPLKDPSGILRSRFGC